MKIVEKFLIENVIPVEIYQTGEYYKVSVNNKMVDAEYPTLLEAKAKAKSFTLLNE